VGLWTPIAERKRNHKPRFVDTCLIKQARALVLLQKLFGSCHTCITQLGSPAQVRMRKREKLCGVSTPLLCSGSLVSLSVWTDWSTVSTRTREQREPFISFILFPTTVVSPTLLSFFPSPTLLLFSFSHITAVLVIYFIRGQSLTLGSFLFQMLGNSETGVDLCSRCRYA